MSAFELYVEPERITVNPRNGRFLKGHVPHNKGKSWKKWLPKRHQKKILKCLELGRTGRGNPNLPGSNRRAVVSVHPETGEWHVYSSAQVAGEITGICARNIRTVCHKKRKHAGGLRWFFENDNDWTKLIKQ